MSHVGFRNASVSMQGLWLPLPLTPLVDLCQNLGTGGGQSERAKKLSYGKRSSQLREGHSQLDLQVEILEDSAKDHSRIQAGMELHWASGSTLSLLDIKDIGDSQEQ